MAGVSGVGRAGAGIGVASRRAASGGGFSVGTGAAASAATTAAVAAPGSIGAMLALQEMPGEPVRDRAARRHGEAMLRLLAALQRGRLGDDTAGAAAIAGLADLVGSLPDAVDPGLRSVVSAVALRARIELARLS